MHSEELIKSLAAQARPVGCLRHPGVRTMTWMAIALAFVAGFVWVLVLRTDLSDKLAEPRYVIELASALLTSMMAAAAAFYAGCPGRPIWERFAPFPFMAIWLASLGEGCWQQWKSSGASALVLQVDLVCFESILAVSAFPALVIFFMIRRGAPMTPMSTVGLAMLASTALGAAALRLFHPQDVSLMLLVWQFGSVALLAGIGFLTGRLFLRWPSANVLAATSEPPMHC